MNCDIIILSDTKSDKLYEMTLNCIESLYASEYPNTFRPIVIESNKESKYVYPCEVITPNQEFNYNEFCNIGLANTDSEWASFCNNDLIFKQNWFTNITHANFLYPEIKSFGVWNEYDNWHAKRYCRDIPAGSMILGYRTAFEITGWCLTFKREIMEKVNLSSRVRFWYSDNIYADELMRFGIQHALLRDAKVDHLCSQTTNDLPASEAVELMQNQIRFYMGNI